MWKHFVNCSNRNYTLFECLNKHRAHHYTKFLDTHGYFTVILISQFYLCSEENILRQLGGNGSSFESAHVGV